MSVTVVTSGLGGLSVCVVGAVWCGDMWLLINDLIEGHHVESLITWSLWGHYPRGLHQHAETTFDVDPQL